MHTDTAKAADFSARESGLVTGGLGDFQRAPSWPTLGRSAAEVKQLHVDTRNCELWTM